MNYLYKEGNNQHLIISLHGTGGSVDDLFSIASYLDKNAHLLGFEGRVLENGLRRYFKRFSDGTFDFESLEVETQILYGRIIEVIEKYQLKNYKISIIGYSNGANILISILKNYKLDVDFIGLLHPSIGNKNLGFKNQNEDLFVLVTGGENDPFISKHELKYLKKQLQLARINHEFFIHDSGHSIIHAEILFLKSSYERIIGRK